MIEENRAYWMIILTLVVLVSVALWQFHSLAWGDDARGPSIASAPVGASQDPLVGASFR
jgi:hypothetical protein